MTFIVVSPRNLSPLARLFLFLRTETKEKSPGPTHFKKGISKPVFDDLLRQSSLDAHLLDLRFRGTVVDVEILPQDLQLVVGNPGTRPFGGTLREVKLLGGEEGIEHLRGHEGVRLHEGKAVHSHHPEHRHLGKVRFI